MHSSSHQQCTLCSRALLTLLRCSAQSSNMSATRGAPIAPAPAPASVMNASSSSESASVAPASSLHSLSEPRVPASLRRVFPVSDDALHAHSQPHTRSIQVVPSCSNDDDDVGIDGEHSLNAEEVAALEEALALAGEDDEEFTMDLEDDTPWWFFVVLAALYVFLLYVPGGIFNGIMQNVSASHAAPVADFFQKLTLFSLFSNVCRSNKTFSLVFPARARVIHRSVRKQIHKRHC